jgi:hypothetical protein
LGRFFPLVFLCIALPGFGLDIVLLIPSISSSLELGGPLNGDQPDEDEDGDLPINGTVGLGVRVPLLFWGSEEWLYPMVAPEVRVDYSPFYNQLRVRTALHFGLSFLLVDGYIGGAWVFLQDFNWDTHSMGIAFEVGSEFIFFPGYSMLRMQFQFEFYPNHFCSGFVFSWGLPKQIYR